MLSLWSSSLSDDQVETNTNRYSQTTPQKCSLFQAFEKQVESTKQKYTSNKKMINYELFSTTITADSLCDAFSVVMWTSVNPAFKSNWTDEIIYMCRAHIHALYVIIPQSDIRGVQFQENRGATFFNKKKAKRQPISYCSRRKVCGKFAFEANRVMYQILRARGPS